MKHIIKRLLPPPLRFLLRRLGIKTRDVLTSQRFRFARSTQRNRELGRTFRERITIDQCINVSRWAENKKHNLKLAIAGFQDTAVQPGQIFSFWHLVGNPTEKAGYKVGINIIAGELDFDVGGGLCQLSGLLYHLALAAGMEIVERYPHSVDLYTDETRYTPLGADATTAYGYKDLRLKNSLGTAVCFRIHIQENHLIGSLCASQALHEYELDFRKEVNEQVELVTTLRKTARGDWETVRTQTYRMSDHNEEI
jgi:vancomycin resistance protein VanW